MPRGKDHHYAVRVTWTGAAEGGTRDYKSYSREYRADFDGKPSISGSADPAFGGDPALHNPEDMLVLALSSNDLNRNRKSIGRETKRYDTCRVSSHIQPHGECHPTGCLFSIHKTIAIDFWVLTARCRSDDQRC